MVYNDRQSGFSLMEVLFAIMVLTMGLVFVASMFPIGLANSHKVIEATLAPIDAHNAQVMMELQLGSVNLETTEGVYLLDDPNLVVQDFSCCALYRCINANTFRFYFLYMRKVSNARYAMQDVVVGSPEAPAGLGDEQDRVFPVPWQVNLQPGNPVNPADFPQGDPIDRFVLNDYTATPANANAIANILRPGSVIVDIGSGYVNEILDIGPNEDNEWLIKLRNNLDIDPLQRFWVVPPAIDRNTREFADKQPVVNVIQKVIQF